MASIFFIEISQPVLHLHCFFSQKIISSEQEIYFFGFFTFYIHKIVVMLIHIKPIGHSFEISQIIPIITILLSVIFKSIINNN